MRWEVLGADKVSGADRTITIYADDEKAAHAMASKAGLLVSAALPQQEARYPSRAGAVFVLLLGMAASVAANIGYAEWSRGRDISESNRYESAVFSYMNMRDAVFTRIRIGAGDSDPNLVAAKRGEAEAADTLFRVAKETGKPGYNDPRLLAQREYR